VVPLVYPWQAVLGMVVVGPLLAALAAGVGALLRCGPACHDEFDDDAECNE
jgi:hypothetical protein